MLSAPRARIGTLAARCRPVLSQRRSVTDNPVPANVPNPKAPTKSISETNATPTSSFGSYDGFLQETPEQARAVVENQAPNRKGVWARSQNPRERAMTGPRFEQTIMSAQPRPAAAIELIHKQPVRWTSQRKVSCDGGGGPLGHPRIFINVDKPQINFCTYCGVPFANEHHRKHIEAHPELQTYPLDPVGDAAEVPESQSLTGKPFEVR